MKHGKIIASAFLSLGAILLMMSPVRGATLTATPGHTEFGIIDEGVNAVVTVVVENTGKSPVEITNVQTS